MTAALDILASVLAAAEPPAHMPEEEKGAKWQKLLDFFKTERRVRVGDRVFVARTLPRKYAGAQWLIQVWLDGNVDRSVNYILDYTYYHQEGLKLCASYNSRLARAPHYAFGTLFRRDLEHALTSPQAFIGSAIAMVERIPNQKFAFSPELVTAAAEPDSALDIVAELQKYVKRVHVVDRKTGLDVKIISAAWRSMGQTCAIMFVVKMPHVIDGPHEIYTNAQLRFTPDHEHADLELLSARHHSIDVAANPKATAREIITLCVRELQESYARQLSEINTTQAAAEPPVFSRLHALLDNQADATDDGRYKLLLADMHMYMLYVDLEAHTYQIRIEGGREGTEVDGPVLKLPATDAAAAALIKKIQAEFKAAEANVSRLYQEVNDAVDNYSTTMEALLAKYKLPARPVPYIDAEDAGFVYLQVVRA